MVFHNFLNAFIFRLLCHLWLKRDCNATLRYLNQKLYLKINIRTDTTILGHNSQNLSENYQIFVFKLC